MITAEEVNQIPVDMDINSYIENAEGTIIACQKANMKSTSILVPPQIYRDVVQIIKDSHYEVSMNKDNDDFIIINISW